MRYLIALVLVAGIVATIIWQVTRITGTSVVTGGSATIIDANARKVHVYAKVENGEVPDILESVSSPVAESASLDGRVDENVIAIPANSTPTFSSDGIYIVLSGVSGDLEEGRLLPLSFLFKKSGEVSTQARIGPDANPHAGHDMSMMSIDDGMQSPTLSITVSENADGTYTVGAETQNFVFDRATDNPEHVPGHGHGHLYLNGIKLQRMYEPVATIGTLPKGEHSVTVELNNNMHLPYENADGPVIETGLIIVD